MTIQGILTRRGMSGFGIAALAAGLLATVPSAANAAPQIRIDKTVDFGSVAVGDTRERTVTITNTGNPTAPEDTAYFFSLSPGPSPLPPPFELDFGPATTCPIFLGGIDLAGGQSCVITYRFTPADSAPAVQPLTFLAAYGQDTDPGENQSFIFVRKEFKSQLVGNVTCGGQAPTIYGTVGNDEITGTPGNDVIAALDGEDVVDAGGGKDTVCGGFGADGRQGQRPALWRVRR